MWSRLHVSVFVAVAAAVWFGSLYISGTAVTLAYFAPFTTVVGLLVIVGMAFEHWAWHWPILHGWFVHRPDIRGTWEATLVSTWVVPHTGEQIAPIKCYLSVTQTFSKLQIQLLTPESVSWLIADCVRVSEKGPGYQLAGIYSNQPDLRLRERSQIHRGAVVLDTHGPKAGEPDGMTGEYWTDRDTKGTVNVMRRISTEVCTRFSDADKLKH